MTPTFDWSGLMNATGNKDRSFSAPGANAISSIFNTPGANPAGGASVSPASRAMTSVPLNIMPQDQGQQPGSNNLQSFISMLSQIFQSSGMGGAGGGTMGFGSGTTALPPASPTAAAMVAKKPFGGLF